MALPLLSALFYETNIGIKKNMLMKYMKSKCWRSLLNVAEVLIDVLTEHCPSNYPEVCLKRQAWKPGSCA